MEKEEIRIDWENIAGEKFSGVIIDTDNEVLIVKLDDGTIKAI